MPASKISTEHRAQRAARTGAAGIPSEWAAVVGQAADFEPDSDAELLDWMARQVTGLSAWAEALVDTYEHCTQVIGIDPQASAMLHDVADAAAEAAETMGAAKAKFTEHYELPAGVRRQRRPDDPRRPVDHRRRRLSGRNIRHARPWAATPGPGLTRETGIT